MDEQRLKDTITDAIEKMMASNVRIERLVQSHDIESDATRVRLEITFDLR